MSIEKLPSQPTSKKVDIMKTYNVTLTHKQIQLINELTGMVDEDFALANDINLTGKKWKTVSDLYEMTERKLENTKEG